MSNLIYDKYDVLPKLNKITFDMVFVNAEKINKGLPYISEYVCLQEIKDYAKTLITTHHPLHPEDKSLEVVLSQIPEDLVIHRMYQEVDWIAYANVANPSGWAPDKAAGKSYKQLHEHVPGMNLDNSHNILLSCVHKGPFERFIWSVVYEDKLDYHSDIKHKDFSLVSEDFFVKVERQVIVGLPKYNCFLFFLSPSILHNIDKNILLNTLEGMSKEQRKYKGITIDFIQHLKETI